MYNIIIIFHLKFSIYWLINLPKNDYFNFTYCGVYNKSMYVGSYIKMITDMAVRNSIVEFSVCVFRISTYYNRISKYYIPDDKPW